VLIAACHSLEKTDVPSIPVRQVWFIPLGDKRGVCR